MGSIDELSTQGFEKEYSTLLPIAGVGADSFENKESVPEDGNPAYPEQENEHLIQSSAQDSLENSVEEDETQFLRYENAQLVKKVLRLEGQIEETRVGLVEIFNQKAPDVYPIQPRTAQSRSNASHSAEEVKDDPVMKELLGYLKQERQQDMSFDEFARVLRSWQRKKDRLKHENRQLDAFIGELQLEPTGEESRLKNPQEFQRNIELLEEALTKKSDTILELERRIDALEEEEGHLSEKIEETEEERGQLKRQLDASAKRKSELAASLSEAEAKITALQQQSEKKDNALQQGRTELSELRAMMESKQKKSKPIFKRFKKASTKKEKRTDQAAHQDFTSLRAQPASQITFSEVKDDRDDHLGHNPDVKDEARVDHVGIESEEGSKSFQHSLKLLEKQLQNQESHLDGLRGQLHREERVRLNLERLLIEGNELIHSLVSVCKSRLREVQSSIQTSSDARSSVERENRVIQELESIIGYLDMVKQADHLTEDNPEFVLIDPPLDPEERRSKPIKIT